MLIFTITKGQDSKKSPTIKHHQAQLDLVCINKNSNNVS